MQLISLNNLYVNKVCQQVRYSSQKQCQNLIAKAAAQQVLQKKKYQAANRVRLGDSDLIVSECCLGTMTWGNQNTEQEAHDQLSMAFKEYDVNFIDTAEMYPVPTSEEQMGRTHECIAPWLKKNKREDIILASKVCGRSTRAGYQRKELGLNETRVNHKQIMYSVERTLKQLNTDYLDLLQIHWPDRYVPLFGGGPYDPAKEYKEDESFENQLRAFEDLIKDGKVRYLGVSNETPYGISEFSNLAQQQNLPKIVSIQNVYNLICRIEYETNLAETCRHKNVGLLAYSPLAGGVLSGKYQNNTASPNSRLNMFPGYMGRYQQPNVVEALLKYQNIAKKYNMTMTEMSLAWCKSRWFITSSIIGATGMDQLKENIEAFNFDMPKECIDDINEVFQMYRDPVKTT